MPRLGRGIHEFRGSRSRNCSGDTPVADPSPFRLSRFLDGSKIWLESGF
jgi:hypothetical protein